MPGVGTVGWGSVQDGHFLISKPLIRPANADLNMTLALALVSMFFGFITSSPTQDQKLFGMIYSASKQKERRRRNHYYCLVPLFLAVGIIEILSIIFRPVSLTFRLFGNIFGGESLLHSMFVLGDKFGLAWIVPLPFYFMEVLIALVQALVFMLLVAVYIGLICNHGDEEAH